MNQGLFCLPFKRRRTKKEKKKPPRVQEALWDFLLFFLWTKVLAGRAAKLHFIQLVWHQAPGRERKCTIKCDLLERRRATGLRAEEKVGEGEKRGRGSEWAEHRGQRKMSRKSIMAHYWESGWPDKKEQSVRKKNRFNKTRRPLGLKIAAQRFITGGEKQFSSFP